MAVFVDSKLPAGDETLTTARDRVQLGPVPAWVMPCPFEVNLPAEPGDSITHLLINRQIHADLRQECVHTVWRLETMQAVQHESQWRLQFEPRTQSVTLHWIRTRRDDEVFEHANRERFRLLQREEGLEGFVIDGLFTLLLVLEDVRPGDILDVCYTIESRPRLLPDQCVAFFGLPMGTTIGKYSFAVRFAQARPMKWKSSGRLVPDEDRENGDLVWNWNGENYTTPKAEPNTPDWHLAYAWMQVSDCPDWNMVGAAIANAWPEPTDDAALAALVQEIVASESDPLRRVEKAIQLVQDEHRYLSVNLELGGQIPSPPGIVVRRRYGDCKDLSFLLANLLKRLGVKARPILVHTRLRKTVAEMLPSPGMFNHAIVEFRLDDYVRWIDPTLKHQGGGALNRYVPDYGVGLPVDAGATGLGDAPLALEDLSSYELRERLLLDTTGEASAIAAVVVARGWYAEMLRFQFETAGVEEVAKDRLAVYQRRFVEATRAGKLEYRDDRAANELVLAETYEINRFLEGEPGSGVCRFTVRDTLVASALLLPDKEARRAPFSLPVPCHLIHTIEIEAAGLPASMGQRNSLGNRLLRFDRRQRSQAGFFSTTFTLKTLADAVAPGLLDEHRKLLESIRGEIAWQFTLPIGNRRPRARRDFGQLPRTTVPPPPIVRGDEVAGRPSQTYAPAPFEKAERPAVLSDAESDEAVEAASDAQRPGAFFPPELALDAPERRRSSRGSRWSATKKTNDSVWPVVLMIIAGIAIFYVIVGLLNR